MLYFIGWFSFSIFFRIYLSLTVVGRENIPRRGAFGALPRGVSTLRQHPVTVHIGKPIDFGSLYKSRMDKEAYQRISDEIMKKILDLKKVSQ